MSRRTPAGRGPAFALTVLCLSALVACSSSPAASDGTDTGAAEPVGEDVLIADTIEGLQDKTFLVDGAPQSEIGRPVAGLGSFEPAPLGTTLVVDGWTAVVESAEVTTQPSDSPVNDLAMVVQIALDVTAPSEITQLSDGRMFPFEPAVTLPGITFVPCFAPEGDVVFAEGERRTEEFCLYAEGTEEWKDETPLVSVELRYSGFTPLGEVEIATTRGPDY